MRASRAPRAPPPRRAPAAAAPAPSAAAPRRPRATTAAAARAAPRAPPPPDLLHHARLSSEGQRMGRRGSGYGSPMSTYSLPFHRRFASRPLREYLSLPLSPPQLWADEANELPTIILVLMWRREKMRDWFSCKHQTGHGNICMWWTIH